MQQDTSFQETAPPGNFGAPAPGMSSAEVQSLQKYDDAYDSARRARVEATTALIQSRKAVNDLTAASAGGGANAAFAGDELKAANDRLTRDQQAYDSLLVQELKAADNRADAYAKAVQAADPQVRNMAAAKVKQAQAEALATSDAYEEWKATAPERKAAVAAQQRLTAIQSDQAAQNLAIQKETDPLKRQQLEQLIKGGDAALQQAQLDLQTAQQLAPIQVGAAKEGLTQQQIGTQAQQAVLENAQRLNRQAATDDEAKRAVQTALAQGEATLAGTRAQTAQQTQGTLAGLDEWVAAQKDAITKGLVKDLKIGPGGEVTSPSLDAALQARIAGTDVFGASQAAEAGQMNRYSGELQQRGQDIGLTGQRMANLTSMANTGLGQFAGMNNTAPPGSDAVGRGLLGWLGASQGMLQQPQFQPPPQIQAPSMPSFLQQYAGQQPQAAGSVTINIGSGQGSVGPGPSHSIDLSNARSALSQVQGMAAAQPQSQPQQQPQGSPAALDPYRPATPDDVKRIWSQPSGVAGPMMMAANR